MVNLGNDWDLILKGEFESEYYKRLRSFLISEYNGFTVFPNKHDIFNALKATPYESVKAVIIGQDPYHNPNEAHGMCFSVKEGIAIPPSLLNIFKELQSDLGCFMPNNGFLQSWANQGVLLLNTILTVRKNQPLSHRNQGWETLTDSIISRLNERKSPIVFLLWGANARAKKPLITNPNHFILEAPHPSPLSAYSGFFGSSHFSKTNKILKELGVVPIDWQIPNIKSEV
ncbi:MAG: uracil-DNA glycosylase [Firmicutes bacterium]|nr:uracil-DNA glycosylase [Bacillota bacterium]